MDLETAIWNLMLHLDFGPKSRTPEAHQKVADLAAAVRREIQESQDRTRQRRAAQLSQRAGWK